MLLDTYNGETHQIKTNKAKKGNLLAAVRLAQLSPAQACSDLFFVYQVAYYYYTNPISNINIQDVLEDLEGVKSAYVIVEQSCLFWSVPSCQCRVICKCLHAKVSFLLGFLIFWEESLFMVE